MSEKNDHRPSDGPRPSLRPRFSRRRLAAGTAGLAAILGAGAYVVTGQIVGDPGQTVAQEVGPIAPALAITPAPSSAAPSASTSVSSAPTMGASGSPLPSKVAEEIKKAREKMAEDGVELQRPVVPKVTTTAEDIKVTTEGSLKEGGIVRIMSAYEDLTGQRELAYVAGGVRKYREVPCSQTFKFSTNPAPTKKPNLLMCWRTTEKKSVVAIVVDPKGKPSRNKAIDALEKKWRDMR
jgi:hypothetical protein